MEPAHHDEKPHVPPPSLWPVGFAAGIALVLVGLIVNPVLVIPIGVIVTAIFGFLWIREATSEYRGPVVEIEPETRGARRGAAAAVPADEGEEAMPPTSEEELEERFPRSVFLEAATLGFGAVIGGIVTLPALGFAVLPAFDEKEGGEVDIGPLENFPEGQFVIATFLLDPEIGEVSRRTAYVRNNGFLEDKPSFTIVSNRCAHLGCPVQASGLPRDDEKKTVRENGKFVVEVTPVEGTSGFACPCHGGAYDKEGNRTAGPPVRALDRYDFAIRNGRLVLLKTYSVGRVEGEGAEARIKRYELAGPGIHIDGPEQFLYPIEAGDLSY